MSLFEMFGSGFRLYNSSLVILKIDNSQSFQIPKLEILSITYQNIKTKIIDQESLGNCI